jgi:hypothetical protein
MVMDALRTAMGLHATVSIIADTGLKDATDLGGSLFLCFVIVFKVNDGDSAQAQRTNERLSAQRPTLLHRPRQSARITNTPLLPPKPKTQTGPYPIRRALPLVEADFNDVLLKILTSHQLAYTPYPTFERLLAQTTARAIFRTWDSLIKEFTNVARELTGKRGESFSLFRRMGSLWNG